MTVHALRRGRAGNTNTPKRNNTKVLSRCVSIFQFVHNLNEYTLAHHRVLCIMNMNRNKQLVNKLNEGKRTAVCSTVSKSAVGCDGNTVENRWSRQMMIKMRIERNYYWTCNNWRWLIYKNLSSRVRRGETTQWIEILLAWFMFWIGWRYLTLFRAKIWTVYLAIGKGSYSRLQV